MDSSYLQRHSDRAKEVSLSALNSMVTPATEINHKKRYSFLICCKQSQSVSCPVKFKLLSRGTLSALGETNVDQHCLALVDAQLPKQLRVEVPGKVKPLTRWMNLPGSLLVPNYPEARPMMGTVACPWETVLGVAVPSSVPRPGLPTLPQPSPLLGLIAPSAGNGLLLSNRSQRTAHTS